MRGGFMQRIAAEKNKNKIKISSINKEIVLTLLKYLKPYKKKIFISLFAMSIVTGCAVLGPYLSKVAIDSYIVPGKQQGLLVIFSLMILTYAVSWYGSYLQRFQSALIGQGVIKDIRSDLYKHILRLSEDFYVKENTGQIISRLTNDVEALSDLVTLGIIFLINDILTLAGITAIMLYLNVELALVTMMTIPVTIFIFYFLGRKIRKAYQKIRATIARLYTFVEENISGIRVVQSLSREEENMKQFADCSRDNLKANMKSISVLGIFFPTVNITGVIGTGLVLWYGGLQVIEGDISLGILTAFLGYISRFFIPLRDLSQVYSTYQSAFAAMERIYEYLNLKPTVREKTDEVISTTCHPVKIDIRNVYFRYNKSDKKIHLKKYQFSNQTRGSSCGSRFIRCRKNNIIKAFNKII
jgi:ATP-binding cassette subfamily B protein